MSEADLIFESENIEQFVREVFLRLCITVLPLFSMPRKPLSKLTCRTVCNAWILFILDLEPSYIDKHPIKFDEALRIGTVITYKTNHYVHYAADLYAQHVLGGYTATVRVQVPTL